MQTAKRWTPDSIRLRWSKCSNGYELREHSEFYEELGWLSGDETPPYICPIGDRAPAIEEFELSMADSAAVIIDLKNMGDSDQEILDFTNKWGQLDRVENSKKGLIDFRNQVRRVYEGRSKFNELKNLMADQTLGIAVIRFGRRAKGRGPLGVLWYLNSLQDFCWLGVVEDLGGIAGSTQIKCIGCGKWFQRSGARGPAPEHCSNACRQRLYREGKKMGVRLKIPF